MGSGVIECPVSEDMFFLPQQPFMPLGTLRQQLLFPSGIGLTACCPQIGHFYDSTACNAALHQRTVCKAVPRQWERVAMEWTCLAGNSAFGKLTSQSA